MATMSDNLLVESLPPSSSRPSYGKTFYRSFLELTLATYFDAFTHTQQV